MAVIEGSAVGGKWSEPKAWVGEVVPTVKDDVVLAVGSGSIEVAAEAKCRSFDATNYVKTLTLKAQLKIGEAAIIASHIGMKLGAGMTLTNGAGGEIWMLNGNATFATITTAGKTLPILLIKGKLEMLDDVVCSGKFEVETKLTTNSHNITTSFYEMFGAAEIKPGSSTIKVTGISETIVFIPATSVISEPGAWTLELTGAGEVVKTVRLGTKTLATVVIATDNASFTESATYGTLSFQTAGKAKGTKFSKGTTHTITTSMVGNGKAGSLVKIASSEAAKSFSFSKATGTISLDFLELKDSHAVGGATWFAGANSTNVSGNEGWKFEATSTNFPVGLSVSQTSSASLTRSVTRNLSATQTSTSSSRVAVGRSLAASQGQSASKSVALGRSLAASQEGVGVLTSAVGRALLATQVSTSLIMRSPSRALSASQGSASSYLLAVARTLAASQGQVATRRSALARSLAAEQDSEATVGRGQTLHVTLTASQGASAALTRGVGRALAASQGASAAFARALTRSLGANQTSSATISHSLGRTLVASSTSTSSVTSSISRILTTVQTSISTISRGISLSLSATATSTATVESALPVIDLPTLTAESSVVGESDEFMTSTTQASSSVATTRVESSVVVEIDEIDVEAAT